MRKERITKAEKKTIRAVNVLLDWVIVAVLFLLAVFCIYALWDSKQLSDEAQASQYEVYKPAEDDTLSFEELQAINPEVFAWLTVYGTNIDYPLTQAEDNDKYVNTNALGEYGLAGSLFLDFRNSKHFSDFNSIIFGHHMAEHAMFGDLDEYESADFLESHPYGALFYDGKEHGIEFFAYLAANAYDNSVYQPAISEVAEQQAYLDNIWENAVTKREIEVSVTDHLVVLSTCSSDVTSGRHQLVGRITDTAQPNPYATEKTNTGEGLWNSLKNRISGEWREVPVFVWLLELLLAAILLIAAIAHFIERWKQKRKE